MKVSAELQKSAIYGGLSIHICVYRSIDRACLLTSPHHHHPADQSTDFTTRVKISHTQFPKPNGNTPEKRLKE